jgi:hypothetical protein
MQFGSKVSNTIVTLLVPLFHHCGKISWLCTVRLTSQSVLVMDNVLLFGLTDGSMNVPSCLLIIICIKFALSLIVYEVVLLAEQVLKFSRALIGVFFCLIIFKDNIVPSINNIVCLILSFVNSWTGALG